MPKAYLTIDDSPSERTKEFVDFLHARKIPALFFVRGALMEQNPEAIEYAIEKGFLIGNHSYAHKPAGDMSPQEWCDDFELCEHLINAAYSRMGCDRPGLHYRFPYIDRGDGNRIEQVFAAGGQAAIEENDQTKIIQNYLKKAGFSQPFENMPEAYPSEAADSLFTYTTGDWMLTQRHKGKWEYKTLEDLKAKIDQDETLQGPGPHVVLAHDQSDIFDEVCALIAYFCEKGFEFIEPCVSKANALDF